MEALGNMPFVRDFQLIDQVGKQVRGKTSEESKCDSPEKISNAI
jgi:hypothetical protein